MLAGRGREAAFAVFLPQASGNGEFCQIQQVAFFVIRQRENKILSHV
jgi:hypothetical protein